MHVDKVVYYSRRDMLLVNVCRKWWRVNICRRQSTDSVIVYFLYASCKTMSQNKDMLKVWSSFCETFLSYTSPMTWWPISGLPRRLELSQKSFPRRPLHPYARIKMVLLESPPNIVMLCLIWYPEWEVKSLPFGPLITTCTSLLVTAAEVYCGRMSRPSGPYHWVFLL